MAITGTAILYPILQLKKGEKKYLCKKKKKKKKKEKKITSQKKKENKITSQKVTIIRIFYGRISN
jgi:hypothetical protein